MSSLALTTAATPAIVGQTAELTVCISQEDHQKAENCELKVDQHHPIQAPPNDSAGSSTSTTTVTNFMENLFSLVAKIKELFARIIPTDQIDENLQERCSKYARRAMFFAISFVVALASASPSEMNMGFKIFIAAAIFATSTDMISIFRMPKCPRALVYLSAFNLSLMTFIMFGSLGKVSGNAIPALLIIIIGIARLTHTNEKASDQYLDSIFEFSASILNCGGLFTYAIAYFVSLHPESAVSASVLEFLFMSTIIVSLYLMVITTLKILPSTRHLKCLGILMHVLVVGTLATIFFVVMIKLSATSSVSN